ncbi:MAG TPA: SRPBCC domain-containing protein [Saprospiraceae bacterium]|nr:SRPBCC domain-containing protein [Saprospiraceae bacterium]HPN68722.1 SRPBCC domain-containing protein [Saprospiraceae bacterium]
MSDQKNNKIKIIKDLGFQVSVSKTFPINSDAMWELLLSEKGISVWLGEIDVNDFEIQKPFVTKAGIEGKLVVYIPDSHLRFRWKHNNWEKYSTVELRLTPLKGKTNVIFHQTDFYKIEQKEELRNYWKNVISNMMKELANKS